MFDLCTKLANTYIPVISKKEARSTIYNITNNCNCNSVQLQTNDKKCTVQFFNHDLTKQRHTNVY